MILILLLNLFVGLFGFSCYKLSKDEYSAWFAGFLFGLIGTVTTLLACWIVPITNKDFPISYTEEHISYKIFIHTKAGNFEKSSKEDFEYFSDHKPAILRKFYNSFQYEIDQKLVRENE